MSLLFSTLYRSLDEWLQFLGIVGGGEDGAVAIDKHDFARATLVGMLLPYTVAVLRMTGASPLTSFSEVQPTGPLLPLHNGTAFYGKFQTYYAI